MERRKKEEYRINDKKRKIQGRELKKRWTK
jgi:hypothetical protein